MSSLNDTSTYGPARSTRISSPFLHTSRPSVVMPQKLSLPAKLFDVSGASVNLLTLRLKQLKDADQHRVVLELGFLDHLLPERKHHVTRVDQSIACGDELGRHCSRRRANSDGRVGVDILLLATPGLRDAYLALTLIEERDLDRDGGTDAPVVMAFGRNARVDVRNQP